MKDIDIMEGSQTFNNLDEDPPDIIFLHVSLVFLVLGNLLEQVPIVCILHYDTKRLI